PTKLDTRYFGELLADVYRKNCDIHSCISEHVAKIRGRKHELDPSIDYKKEEVEELLPKGATELTKQQIRYLLQVRPRPPEPAPPSLVSVDNLLLLLLLLLLQTRLTADRSMRLLLSTFSSLREELLHMSEDLRVEKEGLERDLSFKADQARQYDGLLEAVRENNRQLQLAGQSSSSTLQIKTDELSRQYRDQLAAMREEKDREIQRLRTQVTTIQTDTSRSSADRSLQLRISELLATLEQRQTTISRQEGGDPEADAGEKRQLQERHQDHHHQEVRSRRRPQRRRSHLEPLLLSCCRYRNQYPILGLLSDDYQVTSPVKEAKTIVIERTG
ncbi:unnamed protein product, partial [Tetraodon nigroviridis]